MKSLTWKIREARKQVLSDEIKLEITKQIKNEFIRRDKDREARSEMNKAAAYLSSHGYEDLTRIFPGWFRADWSKSCGCSAYYDLDTSIFDGVRMHFCKDHSPINGADFKYSAV
jgi:hypothetical protein